MSLKAFHIFFISISTLLGVVLIVWGFGEYLRQRSVTGLSTGITGLVIFILLVPYLKWFQQKMRRILPILLFAIVSVFSNASPLWGCPVCYGDPSSPLTRSVKGGILFLAVVIIGLLAAILGIALSWAKKARLIERQN